MRICSLVALSALALLLPGGSGCSRIGELEHVPEMSLLERQRRLVEDYLRFHERLWMSDGPEGDHRTYPFRVNAAYSIHPMADKTGSDGEIQMNGVVRQLRPVLMMHPLEPRWLDRGAYDRILWAHIEVSAPDASTDGIGFVAPFANHFFYQDIDPLSPDTPDLPFFFLPLVRFAFTARWTEGERAISSPSYVCPLHDRCTCIVRKRPMSPPTYSGNRPARAAPPMAEHDNLLEWAHSLRPLLQLEVNSTYLVTWCALPAADSHRQMADFLFALFHPSVSGLLIRIEPIGNDGETMPWLIHVPEDPDSNYLIQEYKSFAAGGL